MSSGGFSSSRPGGSPLKARTCSAGQPETAFDRSRKPLIGPAPPSMPRLRRGRRRWLRSSVSSSSRIGGVLRGELGAVVAVHGAHAEHALDQRVGPAPVDVEPADRLLRQQLGVGDEVGERHRLQQPEPDQPAAQLGRDDAVDVLVADDRRGGDAGHQLDLAGEDRLADLEPDLAHQSSSSSLGRPRRGGSTSRSSASPPLACGVTAAGSKPLTAQPGDPGQQVQRAARGSRRPRARP